MMEVVIMNEGIRYRKPSIVLSKEDVKRIESTPRIDYTKYEKMGQELGRQLARDKENARRSKIDK